jgi:O-antigen ligase
MIDVRSKRKGLTIRDLLMYVIIQFPISSILKVYIGPLNILLTVVVFTLLFFYYYRCGVRKYEIVMMSYAIITVIVNCVKYNMNFYNLNMLIYFPFYIFYVLFFVRNSDYVLSFLKGHKRYINYILYIWNFFVGISFLIPSCYTYEGEDRGFVSFAGTTFLLSPIAIYIFILLAFQYVFWRKKRYIYLMIIPSMCILMGTTRTYLVVLMAAWMIFLYTIVKDKRKFKYLAILFLILAIGIILMSPIKNKFISTAGRVSGSNLSFLDAFTSGRSSFWAYDIYAILHNKWYNLLIGNGINYLFYLNKPVFHVALWAHNDYIQILSDYGILGIFIYIGLMKMLIQKTLKGKVKSRFIIIVLIILWAFNAFFNMFYTYFCALLSYPYFILLLRYNILENVKNGE